MLLKPIFGSEHRRQIAVAWLEPWIFSCVTQSEREKKHVLNAKYNEHRVISRADRPVSLFHPLVEAVRKACVIRGASVPSQGCRVAPSTHRSHPTHLPDRALIKSRALQDGPQPMDLLLLLFLFLFFWCFPTKRATRGC